MRFRIPCTSLGTLTVKTWTSALRWLTALLLPSEYDPAPYGAIDKKVKASGPNRNTKELAEKGIIIYTISHTYMSDCSDVTCLPSAAWLYSDLCPRSMRLGNEPISIFKSFVEV